MQESFYSVSASLICQKWATKHGRWALKIYLGNEAPLLIALNFSEVGVGPPVHHHFIQDLILLPLHGLAISENFTEEAHAQRDVHALHLHMQHEHNIISECQPGFLKDMKGQVQAASGVRSSECCLEPRWLAFRRMHA